ncbi:uncharacterized protein LOC110985665 [Acanthaster planci]|uniref:Uncharacterized protein LOC110985665 n=1 Tax=Acanthaster planci TaxID=133434 RepID=A0A8B7ZA48_ACAPL|nr:uncharacterized protein LOC110985665 [Acanthaster planci]
MSTLLALPFAGNSQPHQPALPMDIRGRTTAKEKRKERRDVGDLVAKKRLENIRLHSAHTRHRNGIINAAEKNRLLNTEKQMDLLQRRAAANISRYQHQLRQELYEMEASRRALRHHSVTEVSSEAHTDMKGLAKFAARGRYLYSVRNETRSQKEEMESYNGRLEQATKLLRPARRQSVAAMDNGKNMGSNPSDTYHEIGRRISMARLNSMTEEHFENECPINETEPTTDTPVDEQALPDHSNSLPPPFDMVKLRSELGPDLQKELDSLEIDDGRGTCLIPIHPSPNYEVCPTELNPPTNATKCSPKPPAKLKLPPVQVNRHFILRKPSTKQLLASIAKPTLSTVSET